MSDAPSSLDDLCWRALKIVGRGDSVRFLKNESNPRKSIELLITSHLIVSKAFLKSMETKALLDVALGLKPNKNSYVVILLLDPRHSCG